MDCALLNAGRQIAAIWWPENGERVVGKNGCESLTVVHVAGQSAYVPWIEAVVNGETNIYNAAMLEGVKFGAASD